MAVTLSFQPASTRNAEPEGLTMIAKAPKEAKADDTAEPTVREKKPAGPATTPNPGSMDDVLREWGN